MAESLSMAALNMTKHQLIIQNFSWIGYVSIPFCRTFLSSVTMGRLRRAHRWAELACCHSTYQKRCNPCMETASSCGVAMDATGRARSVAILATGRSPSWSCNQAWILSSMSLARVDITPIVQHLKRPLLGRLSTALNSSITNRIICIKKLAQDRHVCLRSYSWLLLKSCQVLCFEVDWIPHSPDMIWKAKSSSYHEYHFGVAVGSWICWNHVSNLLKPGKRKLAGARSAATNAIWCQEMRGWWSRGFGMAAFGPSATSTDALATLTMCWCTCLTACLICWYAWLASFWRCTTWHGSIWRASSAILSAASLALQAHCSHASSSW